jgi:hypothetical protein
MFFGFVAHHPVVYQVLVSKNETGLYSDHVQRVELRDGGIYPRRIYPSGVIDIANEFAARQTERVTEWLSDFQRAHGAEPWDAQMPPLIQFIIEKTIDFSVNKDRVGPPIDLIEIDDLGIHWIRKKSNCK